MARQFLGKEVTAALNQTIAKRAAELKDKGVQPKLAILRCGENPSDLAYENSVLKRSEALGVVVERIVLGEDCSKEQLIAQIQSLNSDADTHAVLLFRPLPRHLLEDQDEICNTLLPIKDVDAMTDLSNAGVYEGKELGFPPCTPAACMAILDHYGVDLKGKNVAVIGRSLVVGKPVAMMLMARHATVTVCHTRTVDLPAITSRSDIIISAAGVLGSLRAEHVRPGQIVIDVSINFDPAKHGGQGGIVGDAEFSEVEPVVDAITPVPGGVGTVTTSILFEHVVTAAERLSKALSIKA